MTLFYSLKKFVLYNKQVRTLFVHPGSPYKIIICSVGKAGTHLVSKSVASFPNIWLMPVHPGQREPVTFKNRIWNVYRNLRTIRALNKSALLKSTNSDTLSDGIPVDSDSPYYIPLQDMELMTSYILPGWVAEIHLNYSQAMAKILEAQNARMILILRDPRDVIVSHAHYLATLTTHYMYDYYNTLSFSDRITTSMTGCPAGDGHPQLVSVRERFLSTMPWMEKAYTYTIYFEKLVGARGGGSRESQVKELRAIADHLKVDITDDELGKTASNLFGGTSTFRKGKIGQWKEVFSPGQRQLCKELVGDILIELGYEENLDW